MMNNTLNTRIGQRTRGMVGLVAVAGALLVSVPSAQAAGGALAEPGRYRFDIKAPAPIRWPQMPMVCTVARRSTCFTMPRAPTYANLATEGLTYICTGRGKIVS